ncbi:SAM-dependent methyltransferase [Actinosynnema sp. NPDC020468]|uniref:class I SAM-dependent methyltransferase n=1 Tax=Actinosynnema sp. NPDC020468 TaxID=3154488 RepID=UPI0033F4CEF9
MEKGRPSTTARWVAAQRGGFERPRAPFGDPDADERLGLDVAGGLRPSPDAPLYRYLMARTAFFDRVVLGALERDVRQVVVAGAGYDGRSSRYAKPGVRWFEVDHPDTQRDKRARLARLGVVTDHVTFVPADFTTDDVAAGLAEVRRDRPTLVLCEGVAVYLDLPVLRSLLHALRTAVGPGSRLAISLSVDRGPTPTRTRFREAVAAVGEPARTSLTAPEATDLLATTGWRLLPPTHPRAHRVGLAIAEADSR